MIHGSHVGAWFAEKRHTLTFLTDANRQILKVTFSTICNSPSHLLVLKRRTKSLLYLNVN